MTDRDRVQTLHAALARYFEPIPVAVDPSDPMAHRRGREKVEGLRKAFLKTGGAGPTPRSAWLETDK